jgi:hypothetical protein
MVGLTEVPIQVDATWSIGVDGHSGTAALVIDISVDHDRRRHCLLLSKTMFQSKERNSDDQMKESRVLP